MLNKLLEDIKVVQQKAMQSLTDNTKQLSKEDKLFFEPYLKDIKGGKEIDVNSFIEKFNEYASRSKSN